MASFVEEANKEEARRQGCSSEDDMGDSSTSKEDGHEGSYY